MITSAEAYERSVHLAKLALFAGCNGEPFPDEIQSLRGGRNGAIQFLRTYYDAGAEIRRRTTVNTHKGIAEKRPEQWQNQLPSTKQA